ncbi:MAG: hypothetical protein LBB61_02910, partial [Treponema sp.]|nr:hypothetical protein [Treponema sp.]
ALMTARTNRKPKSGLLFHSDRGVRYCGKEFRDAPSAWRPPVGRSMSRKGNRRDKACAESFFKTLKAEANQAEGRQTKEEGRVEVCEYREPYYNKRRRDKRYGARLCYTDSGNTLQHCLPTVRHIGGSPVYGFCPIKHPQTPFPVINRRFPNVMIKKRPENSFSDPVW